MREKDARPGVEVKMREANGSVDSEYECSGPGFPERYVTLRELSGKVGVIKDHCPCQVGVHVVFDEGVCAVPFKDISLYKGEPLDMPVKLELPKREEAA